MNDRPNVERGEYDRLKAILLNAARHGAASQNRAGHADFRAHLRGRVAWVNHLNPQRGERLLADFARIDWSEVSPEGRGGSDQSPAGQVPGAATGEGHRGE